MVLACTAARAQDTAVGPLPPGYLPSVAQRLEGLEEKLAGKRQQALRDFQRGEEKIYRRLLRKDSARAAQFLAASQLQYRQLEQQLQRPTSLTQYLPFLDTLNTSLQFLKANPQWLAKAKDAGGQLSVVTGNLQALEGELAQAEAVRTFLRQRRSQLTEQLGRLPFSKELRKLNKQAYYYSAQVQEYKALVKDKKKAECKALELLSKTKPFQEFMREHSQLASLFRLPGGAGGVIPLQPCKGCRQGRRSIHSFSRELLPEVLVPRPRCRATCRRPRRSSLT